MVNVKRISDTLEVQKDVLTMDSDQLLSKYTTDINGFNKFLTGVYDVMNDSNYAYYFRANRDGFSDVLLRGKQFFRDVNPEDEMLQSMAVRYRYISCMEETYGHIIHAYPNRTNFYTEQNKCIVSNELGLSDPEYRQFLIDMPKMFEKITSGKGNTKLDYRYLSGVAYLIMVFPELATNEEFLSTAGNFSVRNILNESVGSEEPERYRRSGRRVRKQIRKNTRALEKGKVKIILN